jgi:hypothetical protein
MELVQQVGLKHVEASADTEADPLYCGEEYMKDWIEEVSRCEKSSGVKVVNLYSGHGTYTTLGLGHTDERVRQRMLELWIIPMLRAAAQLKAGLGFYCHAFPESVLQDPILYAGALEGLYGQLARIAAFAAEAGAASVSVEQMYSPQQCPWTISGARDLVFEVSRRSAASFYLTIDTGHQTGQLRYLRPDQSKIKSHKISGAQAGKGIWLGPRKAEELLKSLTLKGTDLTPQDINSVLRVMDGYPFLFSAREDSDTYSWLEALGCYSPIIHLQQVTGLSSAHLPFTAETNRNGSIKPEKVLRSLMKSFLQPSSREVPRKCDTIYLTLEIFAGAAETPHEIAAKITDSVKYWRTCIPKDGTPLDELVGKEA